MVTLPPARTIFSPALRLRCLACGGRPIILRWFRLCSSCPNCGLHLEREPGYWVGSYTVNLFVTEAAFTVYLSLALFMTWPAVPWDLVLYGGLGVGVMTPLAIFPFTKTFYLAVDLSCRPPEPPELEAPVERSFQSPRRPVGTTTHQP